MKLYNEVINIGSKKIDRNYIFCVIADIHSTKGASYKLFDKIICEIKTQNPDYIFIPGDIIYSSDDLLNKDNREKIEYLFNNLSKISKVFISLGNHDLKDGRESNYKDTLKYLKSLEKNNDIYILNNEAIDLDDITVVGFSPRYECYYEKYDDYWIKYFIEDFNKSSYKFDKKKYNIFLTHSPVIISKKETLELLNEDLKDIDLILCGHMHDGLIPRFIQRIGLIRGDKGIGISEVDAIKDFRIRVVEKCRGIYDILNAKMVVTRGIRKWAANNLLCNQVDKICSKDITTIHLTKS